MSDYQSQTPKDKCCCFYDWLQHILIFKYHWYYPFAMAFPHSSSLKKSPAHLYLTRQLSCPSSPNAAAVCSKAPPGCGDWYWAHCSCVLWMLLWVCSPNSPHWAAEGQKAAAPTTHSICACSLQLLHRSNEELQGRCPLCEHSDLGERSRTPARHKGRTAAATVQARWNWDLH